MENVNGYFAEFADWFVRGEPEGRAEVLFVESLDRGRLDYSMNSLKVVDRYLERLHRARPKALDRDWVPTVLRAGAYVGEVIARAAGRSLNWVDFDELVRVHPEATQWLGEEAQLESRAVLTTDDFKFMTAPLNKVVKYIENGSEDSVWYYAKGMVEACAEANRE